MKQKFLLALSLTLLFACKKDDVGHGNGPREAAGAFAEIGSIDIGDAGAAEITDYDAVTQKLFVVNNGAVNKIEVLDFKNPSAPVVIASIAMAPFGGLVNSLDVHSGVLAAAIESVNKQAPGKLVLFQTSDYAVLKTFTVGALPDMVKFSPDGRYILTANEGEPSADYTVDPEGTVSIISVMDNFSVTNVGFGAFASKQAALTAKGMRIFGPNASFAQDVEPEYIAISEDSKTAWVTLQENNAIARLNLQSKTVTDIFPLGFKSYDGDESAIDVSDKDGSILFKKQVIKGMYQPDAIAFYTDKGTPYLFTANEGDAREYDAFAEVERVKNLSLDATAFPDAAIKNDDVLGRLNVTTTLGKEAKSDLFKTLYAFGARSFSVWNGNNGRLLFDSGNDLDRRANAAGVYDDGRSDDKSVEPEGITIGYINKKPVAFVGLERADAVATYDVSNPTAPKFLQLLKCGDAPEGVLFIKAGDSPVKKSLLVVSSEGDGVIKVYSPQG